MKIAADVETLEQCLTALVNSADVLDVLEHGCAEEIVGPEGRKEIRKWRDACRASHQSLLAILRAPRSA